VVYLKIQHLLKQTLGTIVVRINSAKYNEIRSRADLLITSLVVLSLLSKAS